MDSPVLVCDGLNIFMRHFCANPSMSENGEHVGGFVGFIKGLGILCFNGFQIQELPRDEDMEIYIPVKIKGKGIEFNLLAIWNFYWACKQGRFKGVKGDD